MLFYLSPLVAYALFVLAIRSGWLAAPLQPLSIYRADGSRKVALITGATSGVGLALAEALYKRGVHVLLGHRNRSKGESAVRRIRAASSPTTGVEVGVIELLDVDVSSLVSARRAAETVRGRFGRIDWLFLNAGINREEGFNWKVLLDTARYGMLSDGLAAIACHRV